MNKEILEKALAMMQENDHFTMRRAISGRTATSCGTPGCIAGHILAAAGKLRPFNSFDDLVFDMSDAAAQAGIADRVDWRDLFWPKNLESTVCEYDYCAVDGEDDYITRDHAVRCLRKFIDTGVVDWNGTA